eukprot:scaffold7194_cov181-Ochromonas_danica.AAC.5
MNSIANLILDGEDWLGGTWNSSSYGPRQSFYNELELTPLWHGSAVPLPDSPESAVSLSPAKQPVLSPISLNEIRKKD